MTDINENEKTTAGNNIDTVEIADAENAEQSTDNMAEDNAEKTENEKRKKKKPEICALCHRQIDNDDPAVLALSGYGVPRKICSACEHLIDTADTSHEYDEIKAATDEIGALIESSAIDDGVVLDALSGILSSAAERAKKIKTGTYDFQEDEKQGDSDIPDEVPEELRESEEDRAAEEAEEERARKVGKIMDYIYIALFLALVAFIILRFVVFR